LPQIGAKPFNATDFVRLELVFDAQVSPDGTRVAYVSTAADPDGNSYRSLGLRLYRRAFLTGRLPVVGAFDGSLSAHQGFQAALNT